MTVWQNLGESVAAYYTQTSRCLRITHLTASGHKHSNNNNSNSEVRIEMFYTE